MQTHTHTLSLCLCSERCTMLRLWRWEHQAMKPGLLAQHPRLLTSPPGSGSGCKPTTTRLQYWSCKDAAIEEHPQCFSRWMLSYKGQISLLPANHLSTTGALCPVLGFVGVIWKRYSIHIFCDRLLYKSCTRFPNRSLVSAIELL